MAKHLAATVVQYATVPEGVSLGEGGVRTIEWTGSQTSTGTAAADNHV